MNEQKAPISECPHCGSDGGYYIKNRFSGVGEWHHNFDGQEKDNSHFHDTLFTTQSKYAYCINCYKRLFKVEEIGG